MKKILLIVIITISGYYYAYSQTNTFPSNGNVGIGTTNPQEKLEVTGNQKLFGDLVFGSDKTAYFIHGPGYGGAIRFRTNILEGVDRNVQIGNIDNNGVWHSFMTVDQNGNTGIGTTSPQVLFDVGKLLNSGDLASVFARLPEGNTTGGGTYLGVRAYDTQLTQSTPDINNVKSFAIEHSFYGVTNSSVSFLRGAGTAGGSIGFNTYDNTEKMRISGNGNVGIGTTTPDQKLSVKGTIHSQAVQVDMNGWSDYVFKPSYKLASLADLKFYIDNNHHLPDMPSEQQVIKDGLNLGEIVKLQTKKIEELTLYLIELKNDNEVLQKRVQKLENKK